MSTAELIYQEAKNLLETDAQEVLDFLEFLKAKRARSESKETLVADEAKTVTPEEHAAWCERLRRLVESQPMTEGDTVARMREEARY